MDASGTNGDYVTAGDFNDGEDVTAPLPEIPYYDEDPDEAFTGPYNEEDRDEEDESYDDEYAAQSANLF